MSLQIFLHPLSSYCHKVLIPLYENGTAFTPRLLVPEDPATGEEFRRLSPTGKMPLLHDTRRSAVVTESSVIIEYLQGFYPGPFELIPVDVERAWQVRQWDRLLDLYLHAPLQKIVADRLAGGIETPGSREQIRASYARLEQQLTGEWLVGPFSLADCAAAPALFYADLAEPMGAEFPRVKSYLIRLISRPSYARVLTEAEPYFGLFPLERKPSRTVRA